MLFAVGAVGGDGRVTAAPASARTMGRSGGSLAPLLLLLLCPLVWRWELGSQLGVGAARLPGLASGRLAPGPSVEDDNPLPVTHQAHQDHHGGHQAQQRRCSAMPTRVLRQVGTGRSMAT